MQSILNNLAQDITCPYLLFYKHFIDIINIWVNIVLIFLKLVSFHTSSTPILPFPGELLINIFQTFLHIFRLIN